MRKNAYLATGGYRPVFEPAEDFDLWIRFAENHEVDNLPERLLEYRIHRGQVSYRRAKQQALSTAAAMRSAALRAAGLHDVYDEVPVLTASALLASGITATSLRRTRIQAYLWLAQLQDRAGMLASSRRLRAAASSEARSLGLGPFVRYGIDRLARTRPVSVGRRVLGALRRRLVGRLLGRVSRRFS
jgi:hypothetical protein